MSLVRQEIDNLITDQKYISISKVSEATINNSLVNPTEIPDANEKFINDIEIKFHQGGKDSLFTYYNDIFSIASECPFQGGKSVYRARHFVSLFNDTTDFDDDDICAQNGIYRKTYSKLDSENLIVKIIPNPADQTANVILQNNPSGICEIKITDVTNRLVFKKQFDCNEGKYVLNTKLYQPGVYMVHILFNGKYQESLKLIIAR
jgi:hypothetical protein